MVFLYLANGILKSQNWKAVVKRHFMFQTRLCYGWGVSCCPVYMEVSVWFQPSTCRICVGVTGTEASLSLGTLVSPYYYHSINALYSYFIYLPLAPYNLHQAALSSKTRLFFRPFWMWNVADVYLSALNWVFHFS